MKTDTNEKPSVQQPTEEIPTQSSGDVQPEDIDDANFVPVIGHKKSQGRAKKRGRDSKVTTVPTTPGSAESSSTKDTGGHGKGSGNSNGKNGGNGKRRSKDRRDKAKGNAQVKDDEKRTDAGESSGSNSDVNKSDPENPPKKFVEAPLPKVNAWKVSNIF